MESPFLNFVFFFNFGEAVARWTPLPLKSPLTGSPLWRERFYTIKGVSIETSPTLLDRNDPQKHYKSSLSSRLIFVCDHNY